jgi:hypothetical protein
LLRIVTSRSAGKDMACNQEYGHVSLQILLPGLFKA